MHSTPNSNPNGTPWRSLVGAACMAATCVLAACATGEPPVAQFATARESIRQAEGADALRLAPAEMLAARDKFSRAEAASHDKQYVDAARLSDEASADANLAERKARAIKAAQAQQDLQQSNAVLSNEVIRKQ